MTELQRPQQVAAGLAHSGLEPEYVNAVPSQLGTPDLPCRLLRRLDDRRCTAAPADRLGRREHLSVG